MRFETLEKWLDWQQTLHVKAIDLGLERVKQVFDRLALNKIAQQIITVAGTNGKGSTVAYYETWLKQSGYRVASYTSPHLLRYNERIKLDLQEVTDQQLCAVFERIDQARQGVRLTYFEFGTLAALVLISEFEADFAILEVGLGGRLDAVNIINADLAHITPIGLDHQAWLGDTREQIGHEKAGILRDDTMAICNDKKAPESVLSELERHHCRYLRSGRDYDFEWLDARCIRWRCDDLALTLPLPLAGLHQAQNISGVVAGLYLLDCLQDKTPDQIASAFNGVSCPGRLQEVKSTLPARLLVDVGHNADAAEMLAHYLDNNTAGGRVIVVLGMLADKDALAFVRALDAQVDEWWLLKLNAPRGLDAQQLADRINPLQAPMQLFDSVQEVQDHAMSSLNNQDILLVCGSFMTVEAVLNSTLVTQE